MVDPPEVLEMLRLKRELGWGKERIAEHCGVSRTTAGKYLQLGTYSPLRNFGDVFTIMCS